VQHLPPVIHAAYLAAYAAALHPVFLTAAVVMLGAFGLSWLLRDVPLRETAGSATVEGRGSRAADLVPATDHPLLVLVAENADRRGVERQ